jgi:hypothetical protein
MRDTWTESSRGGTSGERPYRAGDPTAPLHADRHARACTVGPYPDAGTLHAHSATQQPAGKPGAFTEQAHGAAETYTGAAGVRIIVVCATAAAAPWKPSSSSWLRARACGGSRRQQQSNLTAATREARSVRTSQRGRGRRRRRTRRRRQRCGSVLRWPSEIAGRPAQHRGLGLASQHRVCVGGWLEGPRGRT